MPRRSALTVAPTVVNVTDTDNGSQPRMSSAAATTQHQNATWTLRGGEVGEKGEEGDVIVGLAYRCLSPREKRVGVLAVQQVHPTGNQHRSEDTGDRERHRG